MRKYVLRELRGGGISPGSILDAHGIEGIVSIIDGLPEDERAAAWTALCLVCKSRGEYPALEKYAKYQYRDSMQRN